ncbi:MAG: DUF6089 family protein [Chitinophagales bacterium]|nr:outer membrane beta-barrel protein [Bacteroidota bacterium]
MAKYISLLLCLLLGTNIFAQENETGAWLGLSNYYGDLNTNASLKYVRPAGGVIYRHNFSDYIALRGGLSLGFIGFKDSANPRPFQQARNLSFTSHIVELSGQMEFSFMQFKPGDKNHYFTPYLTLGLAAFHFNPKATYQGDTYVLADLGTEGQQNTDVSGVKPYRRLQMALPFGLGFKYWIKGPWTFGAEFGYRFAFTDYLDDVKGVYVDNNILGGNNSDAANLADRSGEVGEVIGEAGRQRGDSVSKDAYVFLGVYLTRAIFTIKCPK